MSGRWELRSVFFALMAVGLLILWTAAGARAQDGTTVGSDVVGKIRPDRGTTGMVGVPAAAQKPMEALLERFRAIALRDPALRPPIGFDLRTALHAYTPPLPVSAHPPLAGSMTGLLYYYQYMPAYAQVRPLPLAPHGFFIRANNLAEAFEGADRWQIDEEGHTYWEPKEIRRLGGFPQYDNGIVVLKRNPRPIWIPVSREWALRRQLTLARKSLAAVERDSPDAADAAQDSAFQAWLRDKPNRQRALEESYAEMKKSHPEVAEKMRAGFYQSEKQAEQILRDLAARQRADGPRSRARFATQQRDAGECVRYVEEELARLSPAELAAPAYGSTVASTQRADAAGRCSVLADPATPHARRIVRENPDYFNPALPRTAAQVILVDFTNFEGSGLLGSPPWWRTVYERIRDGLDYAALAALLQE